MHKDYKYIFLVVVKLLIATIVLNKVTRTYKINPDIRVSFLCRAAFIAEYLHQFINIKVIMTKNKVLELAIISKLG